jgi:hypothetical protein
MASVSSGMLMKQLRLKSPVRGVREKPFHAAKPGGTIGVKWGFIKKNYSLAAI